MKIVRRLYVLTLLLFISIFCYAGQKYIDGCVKDLHSSTVYLACVQDGTLRMIDSVQVNNRSCFRFTVSDTLPTGLYVVIFNKEKTSYMQFIFNGEDVSVSTVFSAVVDNMEIEKSVENMVMYEYTKQSIRSNNRINRLKLNNANLSKENLAEIEMIRERDTWLARYIIGKYPHTLAAAMLKAELPAGIPPGLSAREAENYSLSHCFDNVDMDNIALTHTYILSNILNNLLAHAENKYFTYNQQVESYATTLDSLFYKVRDHPVAHNFYVRQISNRFKYGDFDVLYAYMEEYYANAKKEESSCEAPVGFTVKDRIAAMKHTTVGTKAPEIVMPTFEGKTSKLTDIQSEYTLLVFWSSYCYHCTQMLPKVKQIYDHRRDNRLEVLAVSMDTDEKSWSDFVKDGNYGWMNYCDFKGWQGVIPRSYNIQGTPTYILLDKDKTIIAKPVTIEALVLKLKELNII